MYTDMNIIYPWKPRQTAMRNAKIRPIVIPDSVDSEQDEDLALRLPEEIEGVNSWVDRLPRGQEYWNARRAFLSSYHFSEDRIGFAGMLKMSVKGMNEAAMGAVTEVRRELSRRRLVVRVFRLKLIVSSKVRISVRCFVPWFGKVEKLGL